MHNYDKLYYFDPPVTINKWKETTEIIVNNCNKESVVTLASGVKNKREEDTSHSPERLESDSSSSLILQESSNKALPENISNILTKKYQEHKLATDLENNLKELSPKKNPVIQITVVPVNAEPQTCSRRHIVKKLKKTSSHTDSFVRDNKQFLSRNQTEIHDIRETTSVDLFNKRQYVEDLKFDQLFVNRITYTKQILNSLNMNFSRENDKNHWVKNESKALSRNAKKGNTSERECLCNDEIVNNVLNDMHSRKNRVTIFGRLGINENDQYVLNCAATVDDKPIETRLENGQIRPPPDQFENNNRNNTATKGIQANMPPSRDGTKSAAISNKTVQCNCSIATDVATTVSDFGECRENNNPLIVISVYPTQDTLKNVKCLGNLIHVNHIQESPRDTRREDRNYASVDVRKRQNTSADKNINTFLRSRSPSSNKPPTKEKVDKSTVNKKNNVTLKKESPNRQRNLNKTNDTKDRPSRKGVIVNAAHTTKVDPFSNVQETEANTNKRKLKKAIIDNYMEKIGSIKGKSKINKSDHKPKSNTSKVDINIDGDNEKYHVVFLQDKLNTGLTVRKSLKSKNSQTLCNKCNENYDYKDTMENFLTLSMEPKAKKQIISKKQKQENRPADYRTLHTSKSSSGLQIRDSLEICRRRDESISPSASKYIKINGPKSSRGNENDKHYRGDKCCVSNPADRDREIRELLGITQRRSRKYEDMQDLLPEIIGQDIGNRLLIEKCGKNSSITLLQSKKPKLVTVSTQYDQDPHYTYPHAVRHSNIPNFSQLQQLKDEKPVILSRKQYDKLKRTLQKKRSVKLGLEKRKRCGSRNCSVIPNEIRKTRKQQTSNVKINRTMQTKQNIHRDITTKGNEQVDNCEEITPLNLFHSIDEDNKHEDNNSKRHAVSSLEIRYANLAHMKYVTFSSNNLRNCDTGLLCDLSKKDCPSIQTIFKGHKRSITPNLGTSGYSLNSDLEFGNCQINCSLYSHKKKSKKPFLKRLMSCLVMRSAKVSDGMLPPGGKGEQYSYTSSFDSYYINTSLGPMEMTSSLYDTSASFWTNHSIVPVAKLKKNLLSSVKGLLTNHKS